MAKKTTVKKEVATNPENVPASGNTVPETKATAKISKVVFTRKNGSTREFNATLHGENFVDVANEFAKTNEKFIASRQDL
jgi:hypothetical protein